MNRLHHLPVCFLFLLMAWTAPSVAQDVSAPGTVGTDASGGDGPPPGSTVITSDELHSDQATHTSVFTGNVMVQGTNFNLTCLEMTVIFTKDNKVDQIIATGGVVITQPDRVTHSDEARYFRADDKFVLSGRPEILDHKNKITAAIITIYRTTQKLETSGPSRVRVELGSSTSTENSSGSSTPTPSTGNP